ncbi:MAG: SDR family oxidoreductase [Gemmatimonadota bacterium]|nr:SDR family oxidoreductase [Gemmatimonadota bacterium]
MAAAKKAATKATKKMAGRAASPARTSPQSNKEVQHAAKYPKPPFRPQHQESPGLESALDPRPQYMAPLYKGSGKLDGKTAIITGGDSGIGRATAVLFAREGADVAIIFLPQEESDARETATAIEGEGRRALLIPGDVTDARFCAEAVKRTIATFGSIDVLVNNAGFQKNQEKLEDVTEDQWDKTFRTNIYGYFHMVKAAVPHMRAGSAIVNTGSITGLEGEKTLLDYSSTKGAIHAFTKTLAQMLSEKKIRVNAVAPGPVWTPLNPSAKPASEVAKFGKDVVMGRPAQPEELAPAYVFLASNITSSFISGVILPVLGGDTVAG